MKLVSPSLEYKNSFLKGLKELMPESPAPESLQWTIDNFEKYLNSFTNVKDGGNVSMGKVPYSEYWLIDKNEYVGTIIIRHEPSGRYENIKSHVYFHIIPSKRTRGYGSKALELGLKKAEEIGLKELIITCDESNIASQKIIEKNGGILTEQTTSPDGERMRKYIIKLTLR
jgi:predicted acetyltransferase